MEFSTDTARRQEPTRKTTILVGDALLTLPTLPPQSINCIVTSPPYWGLRDYGVPPSDWPEIVYQPMPGLPSITIPPISCCLGLEPTPEAFIGHLLHVFRLAGEALREDGTCFVNLGDSYTSGGRTWRDSDAKNEARRMNYRAPTSQGLKPKDLVGIPWRFAFAMQADGWYLRQDIIWAKPNTMPESVTDRCTKAHEYMFLLSKSERYYFDAEAIQEASVGGQTGAAASFKRTGSKREQSIPGQSKGTHRPDRIDQQFDGPTRNRRSVWTIATQPYSGAHFATFPPALIEPCILAGCPTDGTVLDTFGGAGTTGLVASRLVRSSVLCELSPEYAELAAERIRSESPMFNRVEVVR